MSTTNQMINKFFDKTGPVIYRNFMESDLEHLPEIHSYESHGSVLFRARMQIGYERKSGKALMKNFYAKTPELVEKKLRAYIERELSGCTLRGSEGRTVNYQFQLWLRCEKMGRVRPRTYDRLEAVFQNQIKPYLEGIEMKELTKAECQQVLQRNIEKGYCASTIRKISVLMREFLRMKAEEDPDFRNPMATLKNYSDEYIQDWQDKLRELREEVRAKQAAGKHLTEAEQSLADSTLPMQSMETRILTPEEVARLKDALRGICPGWEQEEKENPEKKHKPLPQPEFFLFMVNTGLRAGEAIALRYTDVDFEKKLLHVNRNRGIAKRRDSDGNLLGGNVYLEGKPKTKASRRTLHLSKAAMRYLEQLRAKERKGYDGYIANQKGKPISANTLRNRFDRLLDAAQVEHLGLHMLRHTFATRYYEYCNGSRKLVGDYLGHSSRNITEAVYVNLSDKYLDRAIEDFEI